MDLNFQEGTDFILQKSQTEGIENPLCIGINENLLSFLGRNIEDLKSKILPLADISNTELKVSIYEGLKFRNSNVPIIFKIDATNNNINFLISLRFEFYDINTPTLPFAIAEFILKVEAEPFMATSHKNFLAISIKQVQLDGGISYPALDPDEIIRRFGSIPNFKQYVDQIIEKISEVHVESDFNNILPSIFSAIELPNTWRYVERYEVRFEKIYYEQGTIADEPRGFLFIVFSVKSLMLPPPCQCIPRLQENDDSNMRTLLDRPSKDNEDGDNYRGDDTWITFGLSLAALQEIIKPYTHYAQRIDNTFLSRDDVVYGDVSYWFQFQAGDLKINPNGLGIDITFDTGGTITAYVKDPVLGGEFGYKAVDIRLIIDKISLQAIVKQRLNPERRGHEIYVQPHVEISKPNLEIRGPIPWPISEIIEEVIERIGDQELNNLESKVNNGLAFSLFLSRVPIKGDFGLYLERTDFYENSSIVITGTGTDD
jgi:hypothetical protein